MKKSLAVAALSLAGLVPLVTSASAASPGSLTGLSARQVLAVTLHAANAQRSAGSVITTSVLGVTIRGVTVSGPRTGNVFIDINGHRGEIVYLKGVLYVKFDAAIVRFEFSKSVPAVADKWISLTTASRYYRSLATGITLPSVLNQLTPAGPVTVSGPMVLDGRSVLAVSGTPNATVGLSGGTQTLYVSVTAPFLPVAGDVTASQSGLNLDIRITLKNWGIPVTVTAPRSSTPIGATPLR
jgi:hypothetical protein